MRDTLTGSEIEYIADLCFEVEIDQDYPTDEEISEILKEIYRSETNDNGRN